MVASKQGELMSVAIQEILSRMRSIVDDVAAFDLDAKVEAINAIKKELHKVSPFASEPVDCVLWVSAERVQANDYNPNSVAPPEMELLRHSIREDGYTQPIVAWENGAAYEVVDGFHRNRVGKECADVRERVHGYLPLAVANAERIDKGDRMAATIRHNRARGKHKVEAMSDIVMELRRRRWSDEKIATELGMDPDEVLRLSQVSGLAELFADREFSEAWEASVEDQASVASLHEVGGLESGDVEDGPQG